MLVTRYQRLRNARLLHHASFRRLSVQSASSSNLVHPNPATSVTTSGYFSNHQNLPMEVIRHIYWMKQKYDLGQDMYLCGHPGALRRNMVNLFADMYGFEVEYLCITRDTTESDLKQRREIYNNSVVFHDQAPVRAAIHGRILVLDGIEHAERNVLPALNNLLENREMNLEDGRFLMPAFSNTPSSQVQDKTGLVKSVSSHTVVPVHPNFRVIALGCSVPPYNGRTMDPPLRSRFQSRFVDELSTESVLQLLAPDVEALQSKHSSSPSILSSIFSLYESLRQIRTSQVAEQGSNSGSLTAMPLFSLDAISHCLRVHSSVPGLRLLDTVGRCAPALTFLNHALPTQLRTAIQLPVKELQKLTHNQTSQDHAKFNIPVVKSSNDSGVQIRSVNGAPTVDSDSFPNLLSTQTSVLGSMLLDYSHGRHMCVLGAKVSY